MAESAKQLTQLEMFDIAVKKVSADLIPAAVAAAVAAVKQADATAAAQRQAIPQHRAPQRCTECGQQATACEGKHVDMIVYPTRYPQHADYFRGVILNGITYLSNNEGHKVRVPAAAESNILQIVQAYEQNEQEMQLGRSKQHHSGHIGPNGSSTSQAQMAWR